MILNYYIMPQKLLPPGVYDGMGDRPLLKESGFSEEVLETLHLPIGLDISNGSPGEIAVAILAEILQVKNGKELRSMKDRMAGAGGTAR
jgi:xanthine dehydrogenase accessory factor